MGLGSRKYGGQSATGYFLRAILVAPLKNYLLPLIFVVLWSSGFIGAKFGLPYAEPGTFLAYRFTTVAVILAVIGLLIRSSWPRRAMAWLHMIVVGLFIQAINLGAVFYAIHLGLDAGVAAIINGIQPISVALLAVPLLRERITRRQWLGFLLGFVGVAMVIWRKLQFDTATPLTLGLCFVALAGLSLGILYQKKFCSEMALLPGTTIQSGAAAVAMWIAAIYLDEGDIQWTGEFIMAFAWLCIVLSVGAIGLLSTLIRRGQASKVSSLFFLVPPVTALIAYFLFGETFTLFGLFGMAMTMVGVLMVRQPR
jgi:drug/metabolite transporter (DMT)-like permease